MNIASLLDKAQQLMAVAVQAKQEAQSLLHKLPGFSFDETMAGPITLAGAQHPQHMEFRLHAEVPSLGEFLSDGRTEIPARCRFLTWQSLRRYRARCGSCRWSE